MAAGAGAQVTVEKQRNGFLVRATDKFDVSPGGDLKVDDVIGDVTVTGDASGQVEVIQEFFIRADKESEAREAFEEMRAEVKKLGNQVNVNGTRDRTGIGMLEPKLHVFFLRNMGETGGTFTIRVPNNFNADVATTGGDVTVTQLKGRAEVETAGGDVEISRVTGVVDANTAGGDIVGRALDGAVDLSTSGGDVTLIEAKTGPFTVKTSGGDISLQQVTGKVRGTTSGGDIDARNVQGELDVRTSGGDVLIEEIRGASHRASTSGGDVEARVVTGSVDLRTSGGNVIADRVQGRVQGHTSGGNMEIYAVTGDVDISTSGGDLDLREIQGSLTGKTSGGDVRAEVANGGKLRGPIRLTTSGGEVELRLPSNVQASVSAVIRVDHPMLLQEYEIRSDFKLKIEEVEGDGGRRGRHQIRATGDLNGGGPLIELETVNGDIRIERQN